MESHCSRESHLSTIHYDTELTFVIFRAYKKGYVVPFGPPKKSRASSFSFVEKSVGGVCVSTASFLFTLLKYQVRDGKLNF